jgi:hypothetical protein
LPKQFVLLCSLRNSLCSFRFPVLSLFGMLNVQCSTFSAQDSVSNVQCCMWNLENPKNCKTLTKKTNNPTTLKPLQTLKPYRENYPRG